MSAPRHPMQPLVMDGRMRRFKRNAIVEKVLKVASQHGCDGC